jgi:peptidoglycan/LPS O-acetylase OafA/YrhL
VELWGNLYHPYATPWQEGPYLLIVTSVLLFPLAWLSYRVFEVALPRWLALAVRRKGEPAAQGLPTRGGL